MHLRVGGSGKSRRSTRIKKVMAKMILTDDGIKNEFGRNDYEKGLKYYRDGRVSVYQEISRGSGISVLSMVNGSARYTVSVFIGGGNVSYSCSCPRCRIFGKCKHIAAVLLAYCSRHFQDEPETAEIQEPSDRIGEVQTGRAVSASAEAFSEQGSYTRNYDPSAERTYRLLSAYREREYVENSGKKSGSAVLIPLLILSHGSGKYPKFSFRAGYDKLYLVKNLPEFIKCSECNRNVYFGKNLSMNVGASEFDERSREVITVIADEIERSDPSRSYGGVRDSIRLTGSVFDRMFMLFEGEEINIRSGGSVRFINENPRLTVTVEKPNPRIYTVGFPELSEGYARFGGSRYLYLAIGAAIYRCTPDFRMRIGNLLNMDAASFDIPEKDMTEFCGSVLPQIEKYVEISSGRDLIENFLPDDCMPCFYFDINDEGALTSETKFRYDGKEYPADDPELRNIKRNFAAEKKADYIVDKYFPKLPNGRTEAISDEEEIYSFLTESIIDFYDYGEVYATDRLMNLQVRPQKINVGVSVSDGVLNIDFDTGEFPADELEALYQSLLTGRKYHRLRDGRYLSLDGSAYETLARTAHMMQLSPEELADGKAELPAFRAPYADSLLGGRDDIEITRSSEYKSMIRSFKTVEDSDFEVPAALSGILRSYQKTGYRWLRTLSQYGFGGILADEMGLGKTLQVITYLLSLYCSGGGEAQTAAPSIVVCPSSLVLNWADELEKFAPDIKYSLVSGTAAAREKIITEIGAADGCRVVVTSYDSLKRDIEHYAGTEFFCCVLDEGQYIKNSSTLASKSVKRINCRQRFVMTGTPIENRLSELWNLFDFMMPGYLYTYKKFTDKLERPIVKSGDTGARKQLSDMVRPFILRRLKSDVLKELPPKTEYVRRIRLSEDERKVYAAAVLAAQNKIYGTKLEILAALTKLRQICCNPALCCENYTGETSKLSACIELCRENVENGHQILLFSQFTSVLDIIREKLEGEGMTTFTIQGSTSKEKRAELVKSFNSGGADVFLISLKAGGTGLNLTAADVVIHYDPWWNAAAQNQATDRAHRIGQKSCVSVYKLIAEGTIEEKIAVLQERKADLTDVLSDTSGADIMHMTGDELMKLMEV